MNWYLKMLLAQKGLQAPVEGDGEQGGGGTTEGESGDEGQEEGLPPEQEEKRPGKSWELTEEQEEAWSYDPFSPKSKEERDKEKTAQEEKNGKKAEEEGKSGEKEEETQGGEKKVKEEEETPKEKQLREQLDAQSKLMQQYADYFEKQTKAGEKEGGEDKKDKKDKGQEVPDYPVFNIPQPIKDLLFSDDPEKLTQGLGMALQGVAQITHMRMRQEMEQRLKAFGDEEVPKKQRELTEEDKVKDTQKQIKADWAKKYPDLAGDDLKPLVAQVGKTVANETKAQEWNESLRDAIAERVYKILGREKKESEEKGKGEGKKVPFSGQGSNRQGAPKKVSSLQNDISDTLSL